MGKATKTPVALDGSIRGKPYSSRSSSPNPVATASSSHSQNKDGHRTTTLSNEPASRTAAGFSDEGTTQDCIPPPSIVISNDGHGSYVEKPEGMAMDIDGPTVLPPGLKTINGSILDAITPTILQLPPRDNNISVLLPALEVSLAMLLT
jgi:hypothetical protein